MHMIPSLWLWLALIFLLFACAGAWIILRRQRSRLDRLELHLADSERRLETVLDLNRQLAEARDETSLVRSALAAVNRLVGGLGCSFVPLDAWGQPLEAFTFGQMPQPVLKGWAEHLASEHVRGRCETCQTRLSRAGEECPLRVGPVGATMTIACLPLELGERKLGMINIYLPPEQHLTDENQRFLEGLLHQMALAIEMTRLHEQELDTLRQLHRLRSPRSDLTSNITALLQGVRPSIGVEGLAVQVRPLSDERLSALRVEVGGFDPATSGQQAQIAEQVLASGAMTAGDEGVLLSGYPLTLPEGRVMGVLLAYHPRPEQFPARALSLLQTLAAQAALLIENERLAASLEYTIVVQERTRLAREIHDGLAQVIAFLKLQAYQMQTAASQGDYQRLNKLLGENRQALEQAYQEIRHTIDNLRISPEEGLERWVERLAREFETSSGARAVCILQPAGFDLSPEVQVQLVRVVQEALNNTRKHAEATQAEISLRVRDSDLVLEIKDDGRGFDPLDVPAVAQYGLRGMRERAELIGADFQIVSQPGQGTSVRLRLPVPLQEKVE
jgi:two-component system, NarL family, nitrate/nitrite sensor histidine kinase NarX